MNTAENKFKTGIFYHDKNGGWTEIKELKTFPSENKFKDAANDLYLLYKAFVNEGFTEDQAMTLVISTITAGVKNNGLE